MTWTAYIDESIRTSDSVYILEADVSYSDENLAMLSSLVQLHDDPGWSTPDSPGGSARRPHR